MDASAKQGELWIIHARCVMDNLESELRHFHIADYAGFPPPFCVVKLKECYDELNKLAVEMCMNDINDNNI